MANNKKVLTKAELEKQNKEQKKALKEAQALIEKFKKQAEETTKEEPVVKNVFEQPIEVLEPNALVLIKNMIPNLTLNSNSGSSIDFGETLFTPQYVTYRELTDYVGRNRTFFEAGYVYIDNERAIRQLHLTELYKGILSEKEMVALLDLPAQELEEKYEKLNKASREYLTNKIVRSLIEGKNIDHNKVELIDRMRKKDQPHVLPLREEAQVFTEALKQKQEQGR